MSDGHSDLKMAGDVFGDISLPRRPHANVEDDSSEAALHIKNGKFCLSN